MIRIGIIPLHPQRKTFDISGEFARWHSASTYMCSRCEEGGDYLKIDRHVSKVHGVKCVMKPVVDFRAKIEYHMCFECKAISVTLISSPTI